jgi:hypothetical protein
MRECPDCGKVHDCAFYDEMQFLCSKLDKEVNRLLEQLAKTDQIINELEDK